MTKIEHLYVKLMEECAEVQQRASKLMQFTAGEKEPGQDKTNTERLMLEIYDLMAVIALMDVYGLITLAEADLKAHYTAKWQKIEKYLAYSQELGTVEK